MSFLSSLFEKKRQVISDEVIDLSPVGFQGNKKFYDTDFLRCQFKHTGTWPHHFTDCNFIRCEFEFRKSGRNHFSPGCNFEDCVFNFRKAYQYMFNCGQEFQSCIFKGTLKNSGFAIEPHEEKHNGGKVIDCNFDDLIFDLISFRGKSSSKSLSFPSWPVVQFHYGPHLDDAYNRNYFPIELKHFAFGNTKRRSGFTLLDLSTISKDPEDIWAAVFDAPFFEFSEKLEKPVPDKARTKKVRDMNCRHNSIYKRYHETFLPLIMHASIIEIKRTRQDIILSLIIKDMNDPSMSRSCKMTLTNCSTAEFTEGSNYGKAEGFNKKFYLSGMDIDEKSDTLILKGPRKAMGKLRLSFSGAQLEEK